MFQTTNQIKIVQTKVYLMFLDDYAFENSGLAVYICLPSKGCSPVADFWPADRPLLTMFRYQ